MENNTTKCLVMQSDASFTIQELELTEEQVKAKCNNGMTVITFDTDTGHFYVQPGAEEQQVKEQVNKFYLFREEREIVLETEEDAKAWMECDEAVIVQLNTSTLQLSRWNDSKSRWEIIG
jgi:hypothetical protein